MDTEDSVTPNGLTQKRKDVLLHQLITGKIRLRFGPNYYYLGQPDQDTKVLAAIEYENSLYELRFEPWLTHKSMMTLLVSRGIITSTVNQQLSSLSKNLEDLKVDLYRSMFSTSNDKKIRLAIKVVEEKFQEVGRAKNSLYYLTLEGYAARRKLAVLLAFSLYCEISNRRIYTNLDEINQNLIDAIINKKSEIEPSDTEVREIARTNPWRGMWALDKNPLGKTIVELGEHQQSLYMYSHLYDNIRESMECPPDNIINDDDACDGWLILQSRKAEKDRKEKQVEEVIGKGKMGNAQELFIPAKSKEDARRINDMNDPSTKIKLAQRRKQVEARGEVKDLDFQDKRVELQRMAIEAQKARGKH